MTHPRLHPPQALIEAAALGRADSAGQLLVEAHACLCPTCRAMLNRLESVGGALLEDLEPVAMSADALERALADISDRLPAPVRSAHHHALEGLPLPVRALAQKAVLNKSWRFAGLGVRVLDLPIAQASDIARLGGNVQLIKVDPGHGAPSHGHQGGEWTLVLSGAFHDEDGRYGPGDVLHRAGPDRHRPIAEPGETCFTLAITDAPLIFGGVLGWAQRAFDPR